VFFKYLVRIQVHHGLVLMVRHCETQILGKLVNFKEILLEKFPEVFMNESILTLCRFFKLEIWPKTRNPETHVSDRQRQNINNDTPLFELSTFTPGGSRSNVSIKICEIFASPNLHTLHDCKIGKIIFQFY